MNTRSQLDPASTPSTFPVEHIKQSELTVSGYIDSLVDQYRRSTYLEDLTCKRKARIEMCREITRTIGAKFTYRQACAML